MEPMVSFKDYDGVEGFGATSADEVAEFNKALSAGQDINKPGVVAGDAFALRVESLEKTLKVTTFKMNEIEFWKSIPKLPAYNTVEEYNELSSYSENPDAGFVAEGALPEEDSSTYERQYAIIKYVGSTRSVTHVATMVKPAIASLIGQETINGTMHLLRIIERGLYKGDSSLCSLQFDGFEKMIISRSPSSNIVDLRGKPLSEDILTDICQIVRDAPNYGSATHLHTNPKVHSDLSKTFFPKERHNTFSDKSGVIGLNIKAFQGPTGIVQFVPNVFIDDGGGPNANAIGDATKRPASPSITTPIAAAPGAGSLFGADDVGNYFYSIVAVNRYGRSAAIVVSGSTLAVAEGDNVTFGVTPAGSTPEVEWWEIYRTPKNGAATTKRLIQRIANGAGTGASTITDKNERLPGCTTAYLFQQNLESMSFKQLAPMVKIPLAVIDLRTRWAQVIYGTPTMYAPRKNLILINVGRADGSQG